MMGALHGRSGEDMAAKPKKDPLAALMALPGVGKATAKKLSDSGIKSASGVKKAGMKGLAKAGLSAAISKKLLDAVNKTAKAKSKAKSTAKKAATKTKSAASKVKSTAKKAAAKTKSTASKAVASSKKVAAKTVKGNDGGNKVKTEKSKDGRKGKTLKIPKSVEGMAWFRKKS
mgnify:CR=1 FL=1